jgi:hypothetical protein
MRIDLPVNDFTYGTVTDRCIILFESQMKRNYIPRSRRRARLPAWASRI